MKVEVISRETIKPSTPTPNHQKSFKLSHQDQLAIPIYSQLVLFYDNVGISSIERSRRLKASLSEILTRFYPLAGRIQDHVSVACTDDGVEYLEARVDCPMSDVLSRPEMETMKRFVAPNGDESRGPLLLVQATFFECGGMAVGMSISHRVADAATFTSFITAWAGTAARGNLDGIATPDFSTAATLFPPMDNLPAMPHDLGQIQKIGISRRYVFDASKIAALQAKVASTGIRQPTRVEAVSALLWRAVVTTTSRSPPPSILIWTVNLRPRLAPLLSQHCFGNVVGAAMVQANEAGTESSSLISHMRRGIVELCDRYTKKFQGEESAVVISNRDMETDHLMQKFEAVDFLTITSWCSYPLYEADFGWGKPTWVTVGDLFQFPNIVILTDTRDGKGIEAWVNLTEEDMASFGCDQELLEFASSNPSALN